MHHPRAASALENEEEEGRTLKGHRKRRFKQKELKECGDDSACSTYISDVVV